MNRQILAGVLLGLASAGAAVVAGFLPIAPLVSDEPLPAAYPLVVKNGVLTPSPHALWPYFWNVTVLLLVMFFAAFIASFFVKTTAVVRAFFATISSAIALFHYLNLFSMANPVSIYPLVYTISINIQSLIIKQYYLDIGQLFIIYSIYNILMLFKK